MAKHYTTEDLARIRYAHNNSQVVSGEVVKIHRHSKGVCVDLDTVEGIFNVFLFFKLSTGEDNTKDLAAMKALVPGAFVRWDIYPYQSYRYSGWKLWDAYMMTQAEIAKARQLKTAHQRAKESDSENEQAKAKELNQVACMYNTLHDNTKLQAWKTSSGSQQDRLQAVPESTSTNTSVKPEPSAATTVASLGAYFWQKAKEHFKVDHILDRGKAPIKRIVIPDL